MSYIGTTEIGKIFLGDVEIDKAYLGNDLVFSGAPYVPTQYTVTFNPSSNNSSGTVSNPAKGYDGETTTNYAQLAVSKTKGATSYIYFNFNTSSIPANATIDSVQCKAKAFVSVSTSITPSIQMFSNTTGKGSAQTLTTTATTFTFSGETWSRSELSNARVRVQATRNSGSTTSYLRFYGATLTVTYSV